MKKPQTPKAAAASKKNLEKWEREQAMMNRLSDNKEMILIGFALGCVVTLIAGFISLYISMNV